MTARPEYDPVSPDEILRMGRSTDDRMARALFFLCYLTGSRISESARFIQPRLAMTDSFYIITCPVLKKRKRRNVMRAVPIPRGEKARCHEDEMMRDIFDYVNSEEARQREYPFWVWGKPSKERPGGRPDSMDVYLGRRIQLETYARKPDPSLGFIDVKMTKPIHPHFLRHCRAQHLHEFYGFDDTKLRFFFEWASSDMAVRYTHRFKKIELFA